MRLPRLLVAMVIAASVALALAPTPVSAAVYTVPASIPTDCSVDVTVDLQAWLDSLPNGTAADPTVAYFGRRTDPVKCYKVEGTIWLLDRQHITVEANGATFRADTTSVDGTRRHVRIRGGNDITIRSLSVIGSNPVPGNYEQAYPGEHGFDISGARNVLLDRVTTTNVRGDNVWIGDDPRFIAGTVLSENVTVQDSTFYGAGRQGWAIIGARGVTFQRNDLSHSGRTQIDVEGSDEISDLSILDNTVGQSGNLFISFAGNDPNSGDFTVSGNTLTRSMSTRVSAPLSRRSGFTFTNNTQISGNACCANNNSGVVEVVRWDGVTITGNTAPVDPLAWGVVMNASCGTVSGNNFYGGRGELRVINPVPCA